MNGKSFPVADARLPGEDEWAGPIHGELGALTRADDRVQCHICGQFFRSLAAHVTQRHAVRACEYRALFGLNATTALVGPSLRAVRRETGCRVLTQYTQMRQHIATLSPEERSAQTRGRIVPLETRRALSTMKRKPIPVVCAICGKAFSLKASRAARRERHTCGQECHRELLRRDGLQRASETELRKHFVHGNSVRWCRQKRAVAMRLRDLEPSAFAVLSERDQEIIRRYYGLGGEGEHTQRELAQRFGLTHEAVHGRLRRGVARVFEPGINVTRDPREG